MVAGRRVLGMDASLLSIMKLLSLIALLLFHLLTAPGGLPAPSDGVDMAEQPGATVRFSGQISATGPLRWVVAGRPVVVDGHTKIVAADGAPVAGMAASVTAQWRPGEDLRATLLEARLAPYPLQSGSHFASGFVDQILPDHWLIGGQSVPVDRGTLVVGEPLVGAFAVARLGAESAARVIVVAPAGELPLFMRGEILSLVPGGWLMQLSGGPRFVQVPESAYVEGRPVVGAQVDLMALEGQNGAVQALYGVVTAPVAGTVVLSGRLLAKIDGTQPEQWLLLRDGDDAVLATETIVVDRQVTLIDERYGPAQEGAWLEVTATPQSLAFAAWSAERILVAAGPLDFVEGEIERVDGLPDSGVVRVAGQEVILSAGSQLDGRPRVGRYALVYGSRHAANILWAAQVDVRYRFSGTLIERIYHENMETWVISVQTIQSGIDTSPQARVYLLVDHSTQVDPTLQNVSAGVPVSVQARAADGGWVGDWIEDLRM